MSDDPVIQQIPLGEPPWPTIDPFLFCVHHLDHYPSGNGAFGPAASLEGRQMGMDFAGKDGWRMYHGQVVPGFPGHPHRGFETITYVRQGFIDHSDSLGAAARFGRGDTQWLTAGEGIVHSEMFPLLDQDEANTLELFQIWLNLPSEDKLVEPHFAMLWDTETPKLAIDEAGSEVTVVAGELAGLVPPSPPPGSWASRSDTDVAVWHIRLAPGASWTLPAARSAETVRTAYVFDGSDLSIGVHTFPKGTGVVLATDREVEVSSASGVDVLILQGRPIGEPVAQQGPFVMNTRDELQQAFADYRRTQFGGWPWPDDDPVHGHEVRRFARHADGRIEEHAVI